MASFSSRNERDRTTWPNKLEYHLSLFSYALGLISFWRFPYLAYENGGAPFVYAFLVLYVVVGIPVLFLEMAWGQYGNLAPLQAFKIVPAMQGIGVSMLFLSCAVLMYFGVASYYFLIYLASSFSYDLPWSTCNNTWNTDNCQTLLDPLCVTTGQPGLTYKEGVGYGIEENGTFEKMNKCSYTSNHNQTSPAVEYWQNNLVHNDSVCSSYPDVSQVLFGADTSSVIVAPIIILSCFAGARLIVAAVAMANHVRLTGKVSYLLSTVPFAVVVVLMVRCVTLTGASSGLLYLFVPTDLTSFSPPKLWKDACGQVFLSVMASWGGLITWSSYNRFYNKYHIDATLLVVITPILSIMSAISVFGVVGYLSYGSDVDPAMAFRNADGPFVPLVAYSEALSQMWGSVLPWSIVVFVTLFLSATSALFPCLECILSCLSDAFPVFRRPVLRNVILIFLLLIFTAAYYGVPCFLEGTGLQIIEFFDAFSLPLCIMIVALAETLMLSYAFGFKLLYTNTKAMTGNSCLKSHFWTFLWGGLTPVTILACIVYTILGVVRDDISGMAPALPMNTSSMWTCVAGAMLVGFIFLVLVLVAVVKICQASGSGAEKLRNAFTAQITRMSGNGGDISRTNGDIFMSGYTSHQERGGIEILINDDIVTTV